MVLSSDQVTFDHLNIHGKRAQLKDLIDQSELWSTESIGENQLKIHAQRDKD